MQGLNCVYSDFNSFYISQHSNNKCNSEFNQYEFNAANNTGVDDNNWNNKCCHDRLQFFILTSIDKIEYPAKKYLKRY